MKHIESQLLYKQTIAAIWDMFLKINGYSSASQFHHSSTLSIWNQLRLPVSQISPPISSALVPVTLDLWFINHVKYRLEALKIRVGMINRYPIRNSNARLINRALTYDWWQPYQVTICYELSSILICIRRLNKSVLISVIRILIERPSCWFVLSDMR